MLHPLTPIESELCKDMAGMGYLAFSHVSAFRRFNVPTFDIQTTSRSIPFLSRNFPFNSVVTISKHRPCASQEAFSHVQP
jgi:hypothetical protein